MNKEFLDKINAKMAFDKRFHNQSIKLLNLCGDRLKVMTTRAIVEFSSGLRNMSRIFNAVNNAFCIGYKTRRLKEEIKRGGDDELSKEQFCKQVKIKMLSKGYKGVYDLLSGLIATYDESVVKKIKKEK